MNGYWQMTLGFDSCAPRGGKGKSLRGELQPPGQNGCSALFLQLTGKSASYREGRAWRQHRARLLSATAWVRRARVQWLETWRASERQTLDASADTHSHLTLYNKH